MNEEQVIDQAYLLEAKLLTTQLMGINDSNKVQFQTEHRELPKAHFTPFVAQQ